jgi:hypothetical protein
MRLAILLRHKLCRILYHKDANLLSYQLWSSNGDLNFFHSYNLRHAMVNFRPPSSAQWLRQKLDWEWIESTNRRSMSMNGKRVSLVNTVLLKYLYVFIYVCASKSFITIIYFLIPSRNWPQSVKTQILGRLHYNPLPHPIKRVYIRNNQLLPRIKSNNILPSTTGYSKLPFPFRVFISWGTHKVLISYALRLFSFNYLNVQVVAEWICHTSVGSSLD